DPVEEGDNARAARAKGRARGGEGGRAGLLTLQRRYAEQQEGQVAHHDDADRGPEAESETHEQCAVDEVFDVDRRSCPHGADVARGRPTFGLRDEVDAVRLNLERFVAGR